MPYPFWKTKSLHEMTRDEWELLCDGCGICCLEKLEYEDTGEVAYTRVSCRYLDLETCRCRVYASRKTHEPGCLSLTPDNVGDFKWLPETCAYRLLARGEELKWWHHLVSGSRETVFKAGISVTGRAVSGENVHPEDLENYLVDESGGFTTNTES